MKDRPFLVGCLIIIVIVLLVPFVFWLFNAVWYNPSKLFEKKFGFKLPESVKIEKHRFDVREQQLGIKAPFNEADYAYLKDSLQDYFEQNHGRPDNGIGTSAYTWWDMNREEEVIFSYFSMVAGKHVKTIYRFAYITQNTEGQYYLYAVH